MRKSFKIALKNYIFVLKPLFLYFGLEFLALALIFFLFLKKLFLKPFKDPFLPFKEWNLDLFKIVSFEDILMPVLYFIIWISCVLLITFFKIQRGKSFSSFFLFFKTYIGSVLIAYLKSFSWLFFFFLLPFIFALLFLYYIPMILPYISFFQDLPQKTQSNISTGVFIFGTALSFLGVFIFLKKFTRFQFVGECAIFDSRTRQIANPIFLSDEVVKNYSFSTFFQLCLRFLILGFLLFSIKNPLFSLLLSLFILSFLYLWKLEFFFYLKEKKGDEIHFSD